MGAQHRHMIDGQFLLHSNRQGDLVVLLHSNKQGDLVVLMVTTKMTELVPA